MMLMMTVLRCTVHTPRSNIIQNLETCIRSVHITILSNTIERHDSGAGITDNLKLWKRVNKSDPVISDVINSQKARNHIQELMKVMECDEKDVVELIKRNSCLVASSAIFPKIKLLRSYGYSAHDIITYPSILHRSLSVLKRRLELIDTLHLPGPNKLHAVKLSNKAFDVYIEKHRKDSDTLSQFPCREEFLIHILKCSEEEIDDLLKKHKFLSSISPSLLVEKVNILQKFKIPHRFMIDNLRVFAHSSTTELERRLLLLQDKQLLHKPNLKLGYLLCCRLEDFCLSFKHLCGNNDALEGCKDKVEYISLRFRCDESTAKRFLNSRRVCRLSEKKLKQILDFFLQEINMKPEFVMVHSHVMTYSVDRLRERWNALCDAGYKPMQVFSYAVCLSDKEFANKFGSVIHVDTFQSSDE